jgi:hypothetical protein
LSCLYNFVSGKQNYLGADIKCIVYGTKVLNKVPAFSELSSSCKDTTAVLALSIFRLDRTNSIDFILDNTISPKLSFLEVQKQSALLDPVLLQEET